MENDSIFTETKPVKNGSIKNFWLYALILFTSALTLIMVSNYLQGKVVTSSRQKDISALASVQQMNEELTAQVKDLENQLKTKDSDASLIQYNLDKASENIRCLTIINETYSLYISKKRTSAKKKLAEIDKTTLSAELLPMYNRIYDILY